MPKARSGCTVVVPFRDEYSKRHLKPTGDLGRVWMTVRHAHTHETSQPLMVAQRNSIYAIRSLLKSVCAIRILSTTWSDEITPRSSFFLHIELQRFARTDRVRNFDLEDVHVEGAARIAEAVAKYDVDRFVHVSSYNANPSSKSEFYSTKVCRSMLPWLATS